ncbi:MAG TPA: hypothetical protein VJV23_12745 [Candidatus Polarisedimenticolia bacterium]|nr:hypothetical protein [Candidatus Polarisedimenticolia bacterium]
MPRSSDIEIRTRPKGTKDRWRTIYHTSGVAPSGMILATVVPMARRMARMNPGAEYAVFVDGRRIDSTGNGHDGPNGGGAPAARPKRR